MLMRQYLLIGLIFYIIIAILRYKSFKNADIAGLFRGILFGIVFWPLAMIMTLMSMPKKDEDED